MAQIIAFGKRTTGAPEAPLTRQQNLPIDHILRVIGGAIGFSLLVSGGLVVGIIVGFIGGVMTGIIPFNLC